MDFSEALKNLQRSANEASQQQQQQQQQQQPQYAQHRYDTSSQQQRRRPRSDSSSQQQSFPRRNQRPRYNMHPGMMDGARVVNNNNTHNINNNAGPLARFQDAGFRVSSVSDFLNDAPAADSQRKPHIAILAIVIDDLPYEAIWREWAKASANAAAHVSLVCHAKFPHQIRSEWLRKRLLVRSPKLGRGNALADPEYLSYSPEWGSVQITRAMTELLRAAMRIGRQPPRQEGTPASNGDAGQQQQQQPHSGNSGSSIRAMAEADPRYTSRRFYITPHDDSSTNQAAPDAAIPPVDKFIFVSETCIPVRTLDECVAILFPKEQAETSIEGELGDKKDDATQEINETVREGHSDTLSDKQAAENDNVAKIDPSASNKSVPKTSAWHASWVNARNRNTPGTPRNKYERDQFNNINPLIPHVCRWKADQWQILSRPHAAAILNIDSHMKYQDQMLRLFGRVNASDEMYFPTALGILGILNEDTNNMQIVKRPVTFTDWSEGMRNPATYTRGKTDLARVGRIAREQGCLFARKFATDTNGQESSGHISVEDWKEVLDTFSSES